MGIVGILIMILAIATALLYTQRNVSRWLRWAFLVPEIIAVAGTMYIVMSFSGGY
jgi:hypothetical protein